MRKELLTEAAIVGLSTVVVGKVLASTKMDPTSVLFWFSLGALTHLGWEGVGGNRWYVATRKAEDFPKGFLS